MKKVFPLVLSLVALFAAVSCSSSKSDSVGVRTDALDDALWAQSEWISVADAPVIDGLVRSSINYRAADGASWFVAEPVNESKVSSAKWMTAGLGVYELYVNGKPVGEDALKPGFTHPLKTKISYTYDITGAFKDGKGESNQLAVQVTPGWWADKIVTPVNPHGMLGHKTAFRGVLELTYEDGSTSIFGTDTEN